MAISVCFVCLGNICRSPTAEAVMRALLKQKGLAEHIVVDSAGTGAWHEGELPDPRSREAGLRRTYVLESRAKLFRADFFAQRDYIVAMDLSNRRNILALAKSDEERAKVFLLRQFDPSAEPNAEVPDPYYGGEHGFDGVLDICEAGCNGLLAHLRKAHGF